jgi:hypothetical protein
MISYDFLEDINAQLATYRGNGQGLIKFDTRDSNNYSDHDWPKTVQLLRAADPTGLAVAMLISAKIDTTIASSRVDLELVLEEPGFLEKIKEIQRIRASLDEVLQGPLGLFMVRVESLITKVSSDFEKPTKREIAVSLRDAIYAIGKGMKISWLQFDAEQADVPLILHSKVAIYDTLSGFVEALKRDLPTGVHLAKVGESCTVIGFKKPGRIAYMSSMSLDHHTGRMSENLTRDRHMRDNLDLDGVDLRFPDWHGMMGRGKDKDLARELQVKDLSRDRMIWLAMLIELAGQEMARANPSSIRLTESGKLAISHDSMVRSQLPVPYVPSWTLQMPTQAEVFESLGFSEWERGFLGKFLEGLDEGSFLPIGDTQLALRFDTKKLMPVIESNEPGYDYFVQTELSRGSVRMISVSESIAGTEEEIQAFVLKVYRQNMAKWLMKLGNLEMKKHWEADRDWFKKRLAKNAEKALNHPCAAVAHESGLVGAAVVWEQNPKRSGFSALCYFGKKVAADVVGILTPNTAKDLVVILGLKNESMLPEHLQGWAREHGWTTSSFVSGEGPCSERWDFAKKTGKTGYHADYVGVVHFQRFAHPLGSRTA